MLVYKLTSFWVYRRRSFPIPTSLFPLSCQWWSMDANDKSALCHLNNCPSFFMVPKQRPPQEKKNIEKKESEFCFTSPQHKGFCSYRSHLERARIRVLANYIPQWQMGLSLSLSFWSIETQYLNSSPNWVADPFANCRPIVQTYAEPCIIPGAMLWEEMNKGR